MHYAGCPKNHNPHATCECPSIEMREHTRALDANRENLQSQLLAAQSANQQLTEDLERERQGSDSITAQVDGLRAERDSLFDTATQAAINTTLSMSQTTALAAQVATLIAERDVARMDGRGEALQILMREDPEEFPENYQRSSPLADTGDYTTGWDSKKLSALFCAESKHALIERLDNAYWKAVYDSDEVKAERDQLRTQNAELMADGVALRGVLTIAELTADNILSIRWGYDGDGGSTRYAEYIKEKVADALATTSPGAPLIEAVRRAVEGNVAEMCDALAELEKFLP